VLERRVRRGPRDIEPATPEPIGSASTLAAPR
jgi:hypothetical protein